ncbi:YisL family protein [Pseudogracilibacillus sp. SE30717A]|uniref:YisL family protein n=1 Tax=Pseudogracilibacillus sp. SE30717A TaxID=3098293 RepID=UPI00300DE0F5
MAHLHITAWLIAFILLFVVTSFYKQGKAKPGKILHMILRLDYLIILFTGISLFLQYSNISGELIIKVLAGLWAIASIEMITVKTNKDKPTKAWWIQFVIAAVIAIVLGFGRLPLGVLP